MNSQITDLLSYNDFELLYLTKENSDEALDILFKKYGIFINVKIKEMHISSMYYEEFLEEGFIMLNRAIKFFNEENANTFYTYFSVLLKRKFIDIIRKIKRQSNIICYETMDEYLIDETTIAPMFVYEEPTNLTRLEKLVFEKKFQQNLEYFEIAKDLGKSTKAIYSTIERIKKKYRNKNN